MQILIANIHPYKYMYTHYACIRIYIYIKCNAISDSYSSGVQVRSNRDSSKSRFDIIKKLLKYRKKNIKNLFIDIERTYFPFVMSQWTIIIYK